jgi:N-acetylmuramoyl-L-alanine amidase
MIREKDNFISLTDRVKLAHKKNVDLLVSIHANSYHNKNVFGASIWILSNQASDTETINWIRNKNSKFSIFFKKNHYFFNKNTELYLKKTIIDLQFNHSKNISFNVAKSIIKSFKNILFLHKSYPKRSGFKILRSPDLPSLLIETGFISNITEEKLLGNSKYQESIAYSIYTGLINYFCHNK